MRLLVAERLSLMQILPKEGNFVTLKIVRDLQSALSFSEKEHEKLKFTTETDPKNPEKQFMKWRDIKDLKVANKDVSVGPKAKEIVSSILKKLDKDGTLTQQLFGLYEKFCLPEEKPHEGD